MENFCSTKQFRLMETIPDTELTIDYQNYFLQAGYETMINSLNNAFWYLEGKDASLILFHFFSNPNDKKVDYVVCNMGSDIFDCLKLNTNLVSTGGYIIEDRDKKKKVNSVLDVFKKDIADKILTMYQDNPKFGHFRVDYDKILAAMDLEFQAEANYQNIIDTIFDKIGITYCLKFFIDQFRDASKVMVKHRFNENNYLPSSSNFDPLINEEFFRAFGFNTQIPIEKYAISQEEIEYYKIKEKEINWVYAENASICGAWNAMVDTADGLAMLLPSLYEILTDRAMFKKFFHLIMDLVDNLPKLKEMITKYDLENSQGSIYKYNYQQCYELMMLITLFLPLPKIGKGGKASEVLEELSAWLAKYSAKSELILLAYKLGLRVEKTGQEWELICNKVKIMKGTKEKVLDRIEHITEVAAKNPKFVMRNLSLGRLEALVDVKKALGTFLKGLSKEERLLVQSELYNSNIAFSKFKISFKGKTVFLDLKAYAGKNISKLDKFDFCKSPNLRSGELKSNFAEMIDGGFTNRFLDTESKIFREFEDIHLKEVMNQLGAKSANDLKIEVELQTILDPCNVCQGQMSVFQAKYNAEIKIFSSGAKKTENLNKLYPKFTVEKPLKK